MKIITKHKTEPFKTPEEEDLINKLPKSILKKIFSKLDISSLLQCSRVSKGWNRVVLDETKSIEVNEMYNFERNGTGTLRDFSLRTNLNVKDKDMQEYLELSSNIEKLDLYGCRNLTDKCCINIAVSCPGLVKLDLGSCMVTDDVLKAIGKYCPNLEYINVSWCDKISNEGVSALAEGCRILETFMCKGCKSISDLAIQNLTFLCPYLKLINIGLTRITDESAIFISQNCILLQQLCISGCKDLTDISLLALSKGCNNLKILEASGCSNFTDVGFEALAKYCPSLQKMDLDDCVMITDKTLSCLAAGCPNLQVLSLSSCKLITDEGVQFLSQGVCAETSMTMLALDNNPLLTDKCIDYLFNFKTLKRVEVFDCGFITQAALNKLKTHPSAKLKVQCFYYPFKPEKQVVKQIPSNNWCFLYSDVIIVIIFVCIVLASLILVSVAYGYFIIPGIL